MPKPYEFGEIAIEVEPGRKREERREPENAFRILVLGNFSGRQGRRERLKPILVDRDNFDHVLSRVSPEIQVERAGGHELTIAFRELDDFHPDRLYQHLDVFQSLRDLREDLGDPAMFRERLEELRPPQRAAAAPDPVSLASGSLLEEALSVTESRPASLSRRDPIEEYVRAIVAPHLTPKADPKQGDMIAKVDAAIAGEMRALLHRANFQSLEAAWRGLYFLVRNVETGPQLKVYLLDADGADLVSQGMADILLAAGGEPWSLLVGDFTFGAKDAELLAAMANLASRAGAPFLAAVGLDAIGDEKWDQIRRVQGTRYIGLAIPRMLLRLPYGKETESVEQFAFEEMPDGSKHDEYCWGNPGFAIAALIAEAFASEGWVMDPGSRQELSGMPIHVYREEGESRMKPCAELWLTQRQVELLLEQGIMPLISIRDSDRVRVGRIQSIAPDGAALAGRWG